MIYPNFVMIGPAKTGTTSVFNWLQQHPDVCSSSMKETYFFHHKEEYTEGVKKFTEEDFAEYSKLFEKCGSEKIIFEATPGYASSKSAIGAFLEINPEIKILFIHREPVARTYSEYKFHRYKTKRFKGEFGEYVGYKNDSFSGKRVEESNYVNHLDHWVEAFGKDQIAFMHFSELKNEPQQFMYKLCDFLDIDKSFFDNFSFQVKNKTIAMRNRSLHLKLLKLYDYTPKFILNLLTPLYYKLNSTKAPEETQEETILKQKLKEHYAPFEEELKQKYGGLFL